jgi:hypothetical protein
MQDYVESVLINVNQRKFVLFSTQGNEKTVQCENSDQFMNVLEIIRERVDEDNVYYTEPTFAA